MSKTSLVGPNVTSSFYWPLQPMNLVLTNLDLLMDYVHSKGVLN